MTKVCIINGSGQYRTLFANLGMEIVKLTEAELVCFTGGEDVSPELYGAKKHFTTGNNPDRDEMEKKVFLYCLENSIPMVGICRGGQFLNVMSGGEMYQNVSDHTRPHNITDLTTGEVVYVSSTHHQMMKPSESAEIVAVSNLGGDREWFEGEVWKREVSQEDIEVVFYKHSKSLCFQPHPEFGRASWPAMFCYFGSLLNRYLNLDCKYELPAEDSEAKETLSKFGFC